MDRMTDGPPGRHGYFALDTFEPVGLQNILKKVPVSSIFPNASRRGRKANVPRKRTHPASVGPNTSQGQDYGAEPTSLPRGALDVAVSPVLLPDGPVNKETRRTSERPQPRKAAIKLKARTATDRREMSEKILNLTMEILSVLVGEECTVLMKSGERVVPGSVACGSVKQEKLLDLTFRIIQLLTGEAPSGSDSRKGRNKGPHRSVIVERSCVAREEAVASGNIFVADKEDLANHEGGMITESGTYVQTGVVSGGEEEFTTIRIKEESASCDDGNVAGGSPPPFMSVKIKEESVSDHEDDLTPFTQPPSYPTNYDAEDTVSGDDDKDSYTYPTPHTDPPPMLFPNSGGGGPVDFLGFDDNSNLDTDVDALIKHAHTKFSFAPIEGGSGSEEDEPTPEPDVQPPPKDDRPQKSASTTEPNSGEEGPSEEAAVTSTKKDRSLKTYTCSECHECFVRRSDFANHRRDHRRERLTCPECGKVFANKPSLLNHLTGHTGEKPYSCPVCGKCFTRNSNLIVHQATHMERSPFSALNVGDVLVKQIL